MDEYNCVLTVFFENPFWVGVFERTSNGELSVCKVTFGKEPKDCEVYGFVLKNYGRLRFSPAVKSEVRRTAQNPKRMQRNVTKQLKSIGIGTKSQQALQLQREKMKLERKELGKEHREAEKKRMFELKQQKRKEKHKGR